MVAVRVLRALGRLTFWLSPLFSQRTLFGNGYVSSREGIDVLCVVRLVLRVSRAAVLLSYQFVETRACEMEQSSVSGALPRRKDAPTVPINLIPNVVFLDTAG